MAARPFTLRSLPTALALAWIAPIVESTYAEPLALINEGKAPITQAGKKYFRLRDEHYNYFIQSETLSKEQREQLTRAAKGSVSIDAPAKSVIKTPRSPAKNGVRVDCNELPLKKEDLDRIAGSVRPGPNATESFLRAIPEGTLQTFTFVTHSKSIQNGAVPGGKSLGKVTPEWPRVIRTSQDGKLTISYVCHPENPSFNKIEVLWFNDSNSKFETVEYDLTQKLPKDRAHANPETCMGCHASASGVGLIKPIWPEYFLWGDCKRERSISMYGMNDDEMKPGVSRKGFGDLVGCTEDAIASENERQKVEFEKFKQTQKDNPCYQLLPWAKLPEGSSEETKQEYRHYPYSSAERRKSLIGFRPNLRITVAYARLQARQIYTHLKTDAGHFAETVPYKLLLSHCAREKHLPTGAEPGEDFLQQFPWVEDSLSLNFQSRPGLSKAYNAGSEGTFDMQIVSEAVLDLAKAEPSLNSALYSADRGGARFNKCYFDQVIDAVGFSEEDCRKFGDALIRALVRANASAPNGACFAPDLSLPGPLLPELPFIPARAGRDGTRGLDPR